MDKILSIDIGVYLLFLLYAFFVVCCCLFVVIWIIIINSPTVNANYFSSSHVWNSGQFVDRFAKAIAIKAKLSVTIQSTSVEFTSSVNDRGVMMAASNGDNVVRNTVANSDGQQLVSIIARTELTVSATFENKTKKTAKIVWDGKIELEI